MEIGYWLSSEEHAPQDLVASAVLAEQAGFEHVLISDHIHPWVDAQGHSPFVWTTIGAILEATERFRIGAGVTCPTIGYPRAIVAHAAAPCATLAPGRFFLGVGTGENLNEHVTGARWPFPDERLEMLEEAVEGIRKLLGGDELTHLGEQSTVPEARLYTVPDDPPEIFVAAAKPQAAELAGRIGDGLISTAPDAELLAGFEEAGGSGKQKIGMIHVAYDEDEEAGHERAHKLWPNLALAGSGGQELPAPRDFEESAANVTVADVAESTPAGPDPRPYLELIRKYEDAGFTHVYVHQIGDNQQEFAEFAARELMPRL